jgi:tetratricopeptide (TPR) repeat protein
LEFVQNDKDQIVKKRPVFTILRIVALMIIIAGSVFALRYILLRTSVETIVFNQYYTPYEPDIITRSGQSAGAVGDALVKYNDEDFKSAFSILSDIIEKEPHNYIAWFFKGLTSMRLDDYDNAIASFSAIPADWTNPYMEHNEWYYGLALLHEHRISEALTLLEKIEIKKGYYSKKAAEVISRLRR